MCWILELYFLLREKICTLRNVENVADRLMARHSIYVIYTHAYTHITHTQTHTPLYKELYVYYMSYIMNVYTICCNNSVYYLYISLFLCEPTLQIQMTKKFVGCIDFYCKFPGKQLFLFVFHPID